MKVLGVLRWGGGGGGVVGDGDMLTANTKQNKKNGKKNRGMGAGDESWRKNSPGGVGGGLGGGTFGINYHRPGEGRGGAKRPENPCLELEPHQI